MKICTFEPKSIFIHEVQLYDKHGSKTKKEIQSTYDHAKDEVL